eukprot:COSAG05_NODE_12693_length_458_cov_0.902507_1_plen_37_part_01
MAAGLASVRAGLGEVDPLVGGMFDSRCELLPLVVSNR